MKQLYQVYKLLAKAASSPDDEVKKAASLRKLAIGLVKDGCDITLPLNQLSWGGPLMPSERLASFAGFVSSVIGAGQLW